MATATKSGIVAVEVPKQTRGGRKSTIPTEDVQAYVKIIQDGGAASDNLLYTAKGKDAEDTLKLSRIRANSQMQKVKKAILNDTENEYGVPGQLRSRTWQPDPDKPEFMFAIFENANYVPDEEAGDETDGES